MYAINYGSSLHWKKGIFCPQEMHHSMTQSLVPRQQGDGMRILVPLHISYHSILCSWTWTAGWGEVRLQKEQWTNVTMCPCPSQLKSRGGGSSQPRQTRLIWCNISWWDTGLDCQLASGVIDWVEARSIVVFSATTNRVGCLLPPDTRRWGIPVAGLNFNPVTVSCAGF